MKLEKRIVNASYLFWWRNTKETGLHVGWNILGVVAVVFCLLQVAIFISHLSSPEITRGSYLNRLVSKTWIVAVSTAE